MLIPTPRPGAPPGHVPICYYCHEVINQAPRIAPSGHTAIDTVVVISILTANLCIVLGFLAAWIRHRHRVMQKLAELEVEITDELDHVREVPASSSVIVFFRLGHWALVKLPMRVVVENVEQRPRPPPDKEAS